MVIGKDAGDALTTSGANVLIGIEAGTAISAGQVLTDGTVIVGGWAGASLSSGKWNTAVVYRAMNNNSTGTQNTYLGYDAGFGVSGQSSANNVGIGAFALNLIRTGADNVVVGLNAMADLNSGNNAGASSQNVVIGSHAGGGAWANTQTDGIVDIG